MTNETLQHLHAIEQAITSTKKTSWIKRIWASFIEAFSIKNGYVKLPSHL